MYIKYYLFCIIILNCLVAETYPLAQKPFLQEFDPAEDRFKRGTYLIVVAEAELEDILIDPVMIQTIIISLQCQLLFQETGLQSTATNEISSLEVYRGRYIDMLTFCKTKNIFHDYQQNMIHKLNDKQTKVEGVFDFISMPDSIKQLALNK